MTNSPGKSKLTIGLLSLNPTDNAIDRVKMYLSQYGDRIDILVLPELFNTGFNKDKNFLRVNASGSSNEIEKLKEIALANKTAITGSILWYENRVYSNRGFIIDKYGATSFYDKRHLFCKSPESSLLEAGKERNKIIDIEGWKISLVICYDLRFPVWCRQNGVEDMYDLLIVVANWPVVRRYAWTQLLIARAIENQAFVAGVNRTGADEYGEYSSDMSQLFDSKGKAVEMFTDGELSIGVIDLDDLKRHKQHWPLMSDADRYTIDL